MTPGIGQIAIIVLLVLLLFGAGRLPRLMGDVARGIKSFKKGLQDEDDTADDKKETLRIETGTGREEAAVPNEAPRDKQE